MASLPGLPPRPSPRGPGAPRSSPSEAFNRRVAAEVAHSLNPGLATSRPENQMWVPKWSFYRSFEHVLQRKPVADRRQTTEGPSERQNYPARVKIALPRRRRNQGPPLVTPWILSAPWSATTGNGWTLELKRDAHELQSPLVRASTRVGRRPGGRQGHWLSSCLVVPGRMDEEKQPNTRPGRRKRKPDAPQPREEEPETVSREERGRRLVRAAIRLWELTRRLRD